jgi:hypothetical protein
MIRLHVDKESKFYLMKPAKEIRTCNFSKEEIGFPKAAVLKGWLQHRTKTDIKYASELGEVRRQKELATGKLRWPGDEVPPSSALAGRVVIEKEVEAERERGRLGKRPLGVIIGKLYQVGSGRISIQILGDDDRIRSMRWMETLEVVE